MKKYIAATLISITALSALAGCGSKDIGKDQATQIALEDAGFTESDITRLHVSKDRDDGRAIYEVQFTGDNTEYEYEIQASNGDILKADLEETGQKNSQNQQTQSGQQDNTGQTNTDQNNGGQNNNDQNSTNQNNANSASSQNNVQISQEDASKLALDRVPGATERDLKIELDYDDGYYKYEGDIIYDQKEYEFEIDANTGAFLEWSEERR